MNYQKITNIHNIYNDKYYLIKDIAYYLYNNNITGIETYQAQSFAHNFGQKYQKPITNLDDIISYSNNIYNYNNIELSTIFSTFIPDKKIVLVFGACLTNYDYDHYKSSSDRSTLLYDHELLVLKEFSESMIYFFDAGNYCKSNGYIQEIYDNQTSNLVAIRYPLHLTPSFDIVTNLHNNNIQIHNVTIISFARIINPTHCISYTSIPPSYDYNSFINLFKKDPSCYKYAINLLPLRKASDSGIKVYEWQSYRFRGPLSTSQIYYNLLIDISLENMNNLYNPITRLEKWIYRNQFNKLISSHKIILFNKDDKSNIEKILRT